MLERTQLYEWHRMNGDVVDFAGWEMPVRFTDIREEHMAVRNDVGIFDTSHMRRFFISGPRSGEFLQTLTTNNVSKLQVGEGHYCTCLNERGGTHDDLMLYRIGATEYIWITNASNGPKISDHLLLHAKRFDIKVQDRSKEIAMIAVQGPKALAFLSELAGRDIGQFPRFSCNRVMFAGRDCYLCRTGYTGEAGGEILVLDTPMTEEGMKRAVSFWKELLKQGAEFGVKPCGLGARDSTRLEAGFVLYGHELDEQTSPIEARISYAVKFKVDPHYIGYDAVKQQKEKGVTKTRVGLVMVERGVPREHYPVLLGGKQIGEVTSGGMSPVLDNGIGLAYVRPGLVDTGSIVEVDIKGRVRKAKVVEWPFYDTSAYGENRTQ
jgi:aminomethyltransferase